MSNIFTRLGLNSMASGVIATLCFQPEIAAPLLLGGAVLSLAGVGADYLETTRRPRVRPATEKEIAEFIDKLNQMFRSGKPPEKTEPPAEPPTGASSDATAPPATPETVAPS